VRIPVLIVLASTLIITSHATFAQDERRAQLSFSGTTLASEMLIQDVLRNVVEIGDAELDCAMPESVTADVLPADFTPVNPAPTPEGARKQVYERWTVDFCGNAVPILLTFWTLEQGGTAFDLDYPFDDLAAVSGVGETRVQ
jgi:hypothetical protein